MKYWVQYGVMAALAASTVPLAAAPGDTVSEADLRQHIVILASDEYEGRAPGTAGETKTIGYIAQAWANAGLKAGAQGDSWYQRVELLTIKPVRGEIRFTGKAKKLALGDAVLLRGRKATANLTNLPIIFTGYGVDESGTPLGDVSGKLVFMLMDEPKAGAVKDYRVRRDAVAKAGAAAVIGIVPAQAKWDGYKRSFGESTTIASRMSAAAVDGAIKPEAAQALFKVDGRDWNRAMADAAMPGFAGTPLKSQANLSVATAITRVASHNVIGKIPGKLGASQGVIVFLGHWDHLGLCKPEGETDRICNGAVDNASGIAVLIEAAKRLAKGPQGDRDIYFLATTAEEMGLLGAYAFADNPVVPLDKITAAFNLDTVAMTGRGAKTAILGRGTTPLDAAIDSVATSLGRTPEMGTDSNVMIQRQDGWALKAKGVPTVMVGGSFADMKLLFTYLGQDYHGPKDELTDAVPLGGAAEDADLHVALGRYFADMAKWSGITKP